MLPTQLPSVAGQDAVIFRSNHWSNDGKGQKCHNFLSTYVSSVVLLLVLWAHDHSAHPNKIFFLSLLPVPPLSRSMLSPWWAPQPGTDSLLNFAFLTEPFHLRFFLTLWLLCLTVLVLGALLSSFLEEALYKCSIWMNEWIIYLCNSCNQVMGVETSAYIDMLRLPALELRWPLQGLMATTISNSCSLFCITWPTAQDITKESGYTQLHSKFLHHTAPGLVYFLH